MNPVDIHGRIRRLYAAIGAAQETDSQRLRGRIVQTDRWFFAENDFRGGLSDEELENQAQGLIYLLHHLKDPLKKWAIDNGMDPNRVERAIDASTDLQLIFDLSNHDKHAGYKPPPHTRSGRNPRLTEIGRPMTLSVGPGAGSATMTMGPSGIPRIRTTGAGYAAAVVTGTVVDGAGAVIGDLRQITAAALDAWEKLFREFGIRT